jgi:hypothetical protein
VNRVLTWLQVLSLILILASVFGPWVPHHTAALTVTGFELAEFAKFFPPVQGGVVSLARELFYLPLIASLILISFLAGRSPHRLVRLLISLLAAILLLALLLPYSVVEAALQFVSARDPFVIDPQYAGQFRLVLISLALVILAPLAHRLPRRIQAVLLALLALATALLPLWQFTILRPLVVALYAAPIGLGWGLVACVAGSALLLISALLTLTPRHT